MENIKDKIIELRKKLTGDLFKDADIKEEIHKLEMKINGVEKYDSDKNEIECINCGS